MSGPARRADTAADVRIARRVVHTVAPLCAVDAVEPIVARCTVSRQKEVQFDKYSDNRLHITPTLSETETTWSR